MCSGPQWPQLRMQLTPAASLLLWGAAIAFLITSSEGVVLGELRRASRVPRRALKPDCPCGGKSADPCAFPIPTLPPLTTPAPTVPRPYLPAAHIKVPDPDQFRPLFAVPKLTDNALPTFGPAAAGRPTAPPPPPVPLESEVACTGFFNMEVSVKTRKAKDEPGDADIAFEVGDSWTPNEPLIRGAYDGELVRKSVWVQRWPRRVRITAAACNETTGTNGKACGGELDEKGNETLGIHSIYAVVAGKRLRIFEARTEVWLARNDAAAPQALDFKLPPEPATQCAEMWRQPPWQRHRQGSSTGEWVPIYPVYFVLEVQPAQEESDTEVDVGVSFLINGSWTPEEVMSGVSDDMGYTILRREEHLKTWPTKLRLTGKKEVESYSEVSFIMGPETLHLLTLDSDMGDSGIAASGSFDIRVPQPVPIVAWRAEHAALGTWMT